MYIIALLELITFDFQYFAINSALLPFIEKSSYTQYHLFFRKITVPKVRKEKGEAERKISKK